MSGFCIHPVAMRTFQAGLSSGMKEQVSVSEMDLSDPDTLHSRNGSWRIALG